MATRLPELKVKSILITQPEPSEGRSPYADLTEKYKVSVTFRAFVKVDPISAKEFRREKINILDYTAIILTSRTAIEHLFRLCAEVRVELPADMKYFCISEAVALYLQKFITYRKRKVFYPKGKEHELFDILLKHNTENYLIPSSNIAHSELLEFVKKHNIKFHQSMIYRTISDDLSDLTHVNFDIIAFFSPSSLKSLFDNFPNFKQNNTRIAAFGANTVQALVDAGLTVNIEAPTAQAPSLKMALEDYIKKANK
jgi:uroporphyrinogen-III synthase